MATRSYCCTAHKRLGQGCCIQAHQSSQTELDAALYELGMLSTVTNSRKEYLKEKQYRNSLSEKVQVFEYNGMSADKRRVIQMHSSFVTDFSFSAPITNNGSFTDHNLTDGSSSSSISFEGDDSKNYKNFKNYKRKIGAVRKRHYYRPYDFPWKPKLLKSLDNRPEVPLNLNVETNGGADSPTLSVIARQDSGGNKSNPGSPVKGQKTICSSGSSIVRSRSLDDLEISKLNLTDCCSNEAGKTDIDNVSQWINNLHVS